MHRVRGVFLLVVPGSAVNVLVVPDAVPDPIRFHYYDVSAHVTEIIYIEYSCRRILKTSEI